MAFEAGVVMALKLCPAAANRVLHGKSAKHCLVAELGYLRIGASTYLRDDSIGAVSYLLFLAPSSYLEGGREREI